MKQFRTLLILVVALGGLLAYLYFVDAERPLGETDDKPKVFSVEADQIEELKVSTIAGGTADLKKGAEGWQLTSPVQVAADDAEVSGITSNLASLTIQRVVDEKPTDLGAYGLREPVVEVGFKAKGDKEFRTLQLGNKSPTGSDMYAKRAGEQQVFLIFGYLESTFNRTPFDLRDKKILTFDREKVDRVEVTHDGSTTTMVKAGGEWRMRAPIDARGDFGAIENLISRLQSLQMRAIVDENATDFSKYGLRSPATQVAVGAGSAQAALAVGSKAEEGLVYVRDLSRPMVFTVPNDLVDDLQKGSGEYRRKDVFEFRTFNLDRIEITRDGATTGFERQRGKGKDGADAWHNVTANKAVDAAKFEAFLGSLTGLRAESFADGKTPTGLDSPVLTVKATFDEGKKTDEARFGRVGDNVFAGRPDEPGAMKLDATAFGEVLKQLGAVL